MSQSAQPETIEGDHHRYATPRPMMRGRYMLRNRWAVALMRSFDAVCGLLLRRAATKAPEAPKRILVANWAHIGDVLMSLPSLAALRSTFPGAEIGLLVGSWCVPLVQSTGLYDHLHILDHVSLNRSNIKFVRCLTAFIAQSISVIKDIRSKKYDIAIDLYSHFPTAAPIFYLANVPIRCGFISGGFGPFLTHPVPWHYEQKPIGRYGQNIFATLWPGSAIARRPLPPCYPRRERPPLPPPLEAGAYVVVHLGTGAQWREWPEPNWARLIEALVRERICVAIVGAGQREAERAHRVTASLQLDQGARRGGLFLDLPWDSFVTMVAKAKCLICLETSAAHVAAAFAVPTVAIYTGTNDHTLWGPDNPRARILSAPTACAPCHRRGCDAMACIRGVTPERVFEAFLDLFRCVPVAKEPT